MIALLLAVVLNVNPPAPGCVADLDAVRNRARAMRASLPADARIEIVFAPGVYVVTNTLRLGRADSHSLWCAARKGTVRIRGGAVLPRSRFVDASVNGVRVRVADVSDAIPCDLSPWPREFRMPPAPWLYRNGAPLEIARWPNGSGWMTFTNAVVGAGTAADAGRAKTADSIVCDDERARSWDFSSGIWFYGYWCHDWAESFVQGAAFDAASKTLRFSGKHAFGFGGKTWGFAKRRFFALNALGELDAPGEWFLDRVSKKLYVVPQRNEATAEYVLATMDVPFVKADGAVDVSFRELVFECSHAPTAIVLDNSSGVLVEDCTLGNLGGCALQLTGDNSVVRGCRFGNIGKGCVILAGGDRRTLRKGNLIVEKCVFRKWGRHVRTYTPGVLMMGCGNVVRGSSFRDAPHNAVLFKGNDHLIENNEFDRVLMDTGDAGALYTGRNPTELGTTIRGNWFHDIGDPDKREFTSAVYFDDCDWGDIVVSNRFERVGRGVLVGGGNLFRIEGNSFSDCYIGVHIDSRGMTWKQWTEHPDWFDRAFAEFQPFNAEWKAAYPDLERTLGDNSFAPWNNAVIGNRFSGCVHDTQFDAGVLSVTNRMELRLDEKW